MRRHGQVIEHCTDSEDFPENLQKVSHQNFTVLISITLPCPSVWLITASDRIGPHQTASDHISYIWPNLTKLHRDVCNGHSPPVYQ